jgi:hypothetical protein
MSNTILYKSNTRGGLPMTEDAAIRIVFTLQGLYTWTHSNRSQPGISQLDKETSVYLNRN